MRIASIAKSLIEGGLELKEVGELTAVADIPHKFSLNE